MASMLDRLRKRLGNNADEEAPAAEAGARRVPVDPDDEALAKLDPTGRTEGPSGGPGDVLRELKASNAARTDAETLLAEGTYNLKRGNREKDPAKKVGFFREALVRFERLHELLPNEPTICEQVLQIRRGVEELDGILARYAEKLDSVEQAKKGAGGDA